MRNNFKRAQHLYTQILGNIVHIIQSIGVDNFSAHWTLIRCIQNSATIQKKGTKSISSYSKTQMKCLLCHLWFEA